MGNLDSIQATGENRILPPSQRNAPALEPAHREESSLENRRTEASAVMRFYELGY
jgi:hypothetical protein